MWTEQESKSFWEIEPPPPPASIFAPAYLRLVAKLRTGEPYSVTGSSADMVSAATITEAIQRGDAIPDGCGFVLASAQLLARLSAEVAQQATSIEAAPLPVSTIAPMEAMAESTREPLQKKKPAPRVFAASWLRELLQSPQPVEDVLRLADANGIARSTLKRAKRAIGAKSVKHGGYFGGDDIRWYWQLSEGVLEGNQKD